MQWLICYDIVDKKARRRALYFLRKHCLGRQRSCFEIPYTNKKLISHLCTGLHPLLTDNDRLLIIRHSGKGPDWHLGVGQVSATRQLLYWG